MGRAGRSSGLMAVTRWCWTALAAMGVLTGAGGDQQEPGPDWLTIDGHDWQRMDPDVRQAYVEGFLAGAAVGQAANGARDTSGVRAALEELKGSGRLRFPFGSNVYASRVSDYYWWKNHLPLPTWYAFLEVNTTLGRRISDSVP
jgi:hypothetical protein